VNRVGRRIDYFDDPNSPAANSLVPSVNCIVQNDAGEILLIRRTDNGNWSLPGGAMDLGESLGQAAVRETLEETGIESRLTGVSGLYSDPRHVLEYTSNGEVRQEFSIVFTAQMTGGEPTPSSESSHVEWVAPERVRELPMHGSMRKRIEHFLRGSGLYWD
jgi:ADP-ribose pyrophosphatase YjhB (NUDIX family)